MILESNVLITYNHTTGNSAVSKDEKEQQFVYSALFSWAKQTDAFLSKLLEQEDLFDGSIRSDISSNLTLLGGASGVRYTIQSSQSYLLYLPGVIGLHESLQGTDPSLCGGDRQHAGDTSKIFQGGCRKVRRGCYEPCDQKPPNA